ncbi:acylphosphatase [Cladophialophora yegresii CBS 114405]|uniref:acylphosphatase n=1 Tax=Cladophialophora yegresii CBS 114405 TaxID=1182544 RepID=W9W7P0_9EURO|nr:acylphosphatase [Cladophialophora yegresii CBS 114405]EXJ64112.1 acylphosphatase [Cladophialophora yegresii CBS 114405]
MSKRIAFTVHGKVQGVCFRDFAQSQASSYGVTGFVSNTSDGKVAGEAQGDDESLKKLKADLNEGPKAAQVVKVEVKDIATKDGEKSFNVA